MLKNVMLFIFAVVLIACGGNVETEKGTKATDVKVSDEEKSDESSKFHSTHGTCEASNTLNIDTTLIIENLITAFDDVAGVDLASFAAPTAELAESYSFVRVDFNSSESMNGKRVNAFNAEDRRLRLHIAPSDGKIKAGEHSSENSDISLTVYQYIDGTISGKQVGSNKVNFLVTINEVSEEHVCGKFAIENEVGETIMNASFDTDLKVVMY